MKLKFICDYSMGCLWQARLRFARGFFFIVDAKRQFDWQWNPRDSWNYFISKHCVILARTVISKHSAILARSGNKPKVTHFRRHFDIVYWIEHCIIRSVLPIESTSSLFTQPDKRTNKFGNRTCSVFIRPTCLMLGINKKCEATLTLDIHCISAFTNHCS